MAPALLDTQGFNEAEFPQWTFIIVGGCLTLLLLSAIIIFATIYTRNRRRRLSTTNICKSTPEKKVEDYETFRSEGCSYEETLMYRDFSVCYDHQYCSPTQDAFENLSLVTSTEGADEPGAWVQVEYLPTDAQLLVSIELKSDTRNLKLAKVVCSGWGATSQQSLEWPDVALKEQIEFIVFPEDIHMTCVEFYLIPVIEEGSDPGTSDQAKDDSVVQNSPSLQGSEKTQTFYTCLLSLSEIDENDGNSLWFELSLEKRDYRDKTLTALNSEELRRLKASSPLLLVGLMYISTAGKLVVSILKGRGFDMYSPDPESSVKIVLISPYGDDVGKRNTKSIKNSASPVFDETFIFQVPEGELPFVRISVVVFCYLGIWQRQVKLGWLDLGANLDSSEVDEHWSDMIKEQDATVARWHPLVLS